MMEWRQLSNEQRVDVRKALEKHVEESITGFNVIEKSSSRVMRFFSFVLFFVPGFMTNFVTTFYPKVYVPSKERWEANHSNTVMLLAHEYVHLRDRKRLGPLFNFIYLSPQVLVLLALLAPLNLWFLFSLFFLLPLPSPGRMWAELRGYRMTIAVYYWMTGVEYNLGYIANHFTGQNYYWMWPFRSHIENLLEKEYNKIKNDDLAPELREVKEVLTKAGLTCYPHVRR